jgi:hypothetical protein
MREMVRRGILLAVAVAVAGILVSALTIALPANAAATAPTMSKTHWMYFGWQGDAKKSVAYVGGELSPGGGPTIQYFVTAGANTYYPQESATNLRSQAQWNLDDGYLPSPISTWRAGATQVTIQHTSQSISSGAATAVFSRVTVANTSASAVTETVNVNSAATTEIPISVTPTTSDASSMSFAVTVSAGATAKIDFVALASGTATNAALQAAGSFDTNLASMASYWNGRLATLALPVSLPDPQLISLYKAEQITLWESIVNAADGTEERGSGGNTTLASNYNRTFSHDVPDIVSEYIREGDYATAKAILNSAYYQSFAVAPQDAPAEKYLDALAKNIIPYDLYAQYANDPTFFTPAVKTRLRNATRLMTSLETTTAGDAHSGLMEASNDFDNGSDYLATDDFSALYALQAYTNMTKQWALSDSSWTAETSWAQAQAVDLNSSLNAYLANVTIPQVGGFYDGCLDSDSSCPYSGNYTGNWLGTTLMMSSLPWDGSLDGNVQTGTWSNDLTSSVYGAFTHREVTAPSIPAHSWGAWSNGATGYGTTYNAGAGVQLLGSSDPSLRTEAISDVEWLLANQSSPMNWGESFARGAWTTPEADMESWGLAGTEKALLESNVSVRADGTAIIGQGIPASWLTSGKPIAWTNVPVHGGKSIGFTVQQTATNQIKLTLSGNTTTPVLFQLPLFVNNIASASNGTVTDASGSVALAAGTSAVTVTVGTETVPPITTNTSSSTGYTFGDTGTQQKRAQTFTATAATSISNVKVTVRKYTGTAQTAVTVGLYNVSAGAPTGAALATATIPAASIGTSFAQVTAALSYPSLVDGQTYALVLGQSTPSASIYQWATSGSGGSFSFSKFNGTTWTRDLNIGDAAVTIDLTGGPFTTLDLSNAATAHYALGQSTDQLTRTQEFLDTGMTSLSSVRVNIRKKAGGTAQSNLTVALYAVRNGAPTGSPLASTAVTAATIGTSDIIVTVPLPVSSLTSGSEYAVTLGQATPNPTSLYEWATSGSAGIYGFGKTTSGGAWTDESSSGDAWLQVVGTLG